jgi:hypothetical protein
VRLIAVLEYMMLLQLAESNPTVFGIVLDQLEGVEAHP